MPPTGPLPTSVYVRRRAVALAALVLALLLLIWLVVALAGGPADDRSTAAQQAPAAHPQPAATAEQPQPNSTEANAAVTVRSRLGPHLAVDGSRSGTSTAPGTPAPAATPAAPAQPSPSPPGPPQPCPDEVTAVTAHPEKPEYPVGSKPVFVLTVSNIGQVACTRDLDAELQELLLYAADGTTRLWSSNDCYPGDSDDVRTLQPGESLSFSVRWAGRSSNPNCAGKRVRLGPGDYLLLPKLGPLTGAPVAVRLVQP